MSLLIKEVVMADNMQDDPDLMDERDTDTGQMEETEDMPEPDKAE